MVPVFDDMEITDYLLSNISRKVELRENEINDHNKTRAQVKDLKEPVETMKNDKLF